MEKMFQKQVDMTRSQGRDSESKMETQQPPAGHKYPEVWNLDLLKQSHFPDFSSQCFQGLSVQWWEAEQVVVTVTPLCSSRLPSSALLWKVEEFI